MKKVVDFLKSTAGMVLIVTLLAGCVVHLVTGNFWTAYNISTLTRIRGQYGGCLDDGRAGDQSCHLHPGVLPGRPSPGSDQRAVYRVPEADPIYRNPGDSGDL